jgi:hypothetical protein
MWKSRLDQYPGDPRRTAACRSVVTHLTSAQWLRIRLLRRDLEVVSR